MKDVSYVTYSFRLIIPNPGMAHPNACLVGELNRDLVLDALPESILSQRFRIRWRSHQFTVMGVGMLGFNVRK